MNTINNSKLYGWTLHENGILTRIPNAKTLDRLLYVQFGLDLKYLGIPEEFKEYKEAQYLIQEPKLKVMVLKQTISEIVYPNVWVNAIGGGSQCEINVELWTEKDFSKEEFPELYTDWLKLRPKTYIKKPKQLTLF